MASVFMRAWVVHSHADTALTPPRRGGLLSPTALPAASGWAPTSIEVGILWDARLPFGRGVLAYGTGTCVFILS